jgi:hypothetical protein
MVATASSKPPGSVTKPLSAEASTPSFCSNQRTEAKIGYSVLNRMTSLGMPVSVRIK